MVLKKISNKNVVTVPFDATVQEAAGRMREFHVGDVVVVKNENGKVVPVGMLTDRDIVMSTVAFGVAPSSVTVSDVMAPNITTARTTDGVYHILHLMKEHGIRRVPLVNPAGVLEGIVSSEDVIGLLSSELSDIVGINERQRKIEAERRQTLA